MSNPYIYDPSKKLVPWIPRTRKQYADFIKRVYAMHKRLGLNPEEKQMNMMEWLFINSTEFFAVSAVVAILLMMFLEERRK